MHQLVETVLAVRARLAKNDWPSMHALVQSYARFGARLAITLHIKLLYVSWEPEQSLTVWEDSPRLDSANVRIVEADQAHHGDSISGQRSIER